jgi:hypothetical protein
VEVPARQASRVAAETLVRRQLVEVVAQGTAASAAHRQETQETQVMRATQVMQARRAPEEPPAAREPPAVEA